MSVATAYATWLQGAMGHLIEVQADVSSGVVGTTVVGRADVAINEARERCRMAIVNSGLAWPGSKRITILLSPADLAKRGTHFDLAIAVAVLAAHDRVKSERLPQSLFVGELTLTGGLRCVHGVLPMVLSAARHGIRQVFVPEPQVREAALVPGVVVFGLRSLAQVAALLNDEEVPEAPPVAGLSSGSLLSWRGQSRLDELDLLDVDGMAEAKYAVEVAAAGGHHVMLTGPKGAGKTTLAERLPSILPDLTAEESLELTAIHSLAGVLGPADDLIVRPPFFAPHHDASKVGLLGGGSGRVRPGDVSRAHNGVLFLDEFPLFRADVIEALRQPLESGEVTITRGEESATFPARGLVVMACNPCPCGNFHPASEPQRVRLPRAGATPLPRQADRADHRPGRHQPRGPARLAARAARPLRPARDLGGRAGPGHRRSPAAARAVRRPQLAAQLPGARPGPATGVAARRRAPAEGRRRDLRRSAHAPRRDARAPARVDDRRPRPGRRAGLHPAGHRPAAEARTAPARRQPAPEGRRMTASDRERLARVALGTLGEPGDPRLVSLVAELGPVLVHDQLAAGYDAGDGVQDDIAARLVGADPARDLERAERAGIRFVVPGDDEWPTQVDQLLRTETLRDRGGPPLGLWVRGPMGLDELESSVAVVGSRSATSYGTTIAGEIAAVVARAGYPVVSGAAFGIDQAAHRGALAAGGRTVAVLACGVDLVYPPAHHQLLEHLVKTCAVVSELPPGRSVSRIRFLSRNRLIAALTRGTVVVEAAARSGALNTAGWAARLYRPLMSVPGPVTAAQSEGTHELLRKGAASIVTRGEEVLELVAPSGHHLVAPRRGRVYARDRLPPRQQQVLDAVPRHRGVGADAIARTAGIGLLDTQAALQRLERAGIVARTSDGWRIRDVNAPDSPAENAEVPTMNP